MALIDWLLGRNVEERALEGFQISSAQLIPGQRLPVTEAYAEQTFASRIPAAHRARLATINAVGQLPLTFASSRRSRLPALVRRPDPDQTREGFIRETVASLVDYGNAYWRIIPGGSQAIAALKVTDPAEWVVTWDETRTRRVYQYRLETMRPGRDVIVIAMGRGPGDLVGRGPMQHRRLIGVLAALDYSQQYFVSAAEPSGILRTEAEIDGEEAQLLRDAWIEQHAPGTRTPAVLGGGLSWESLGLSPADSEWVATHGAGILDTAQIFGMPARILGYSQPGSSLTYSNVEDVYLSWWRETLQPEYAAPIEEALSSVLAPQDSVTFDPSAFLRGDVAQRYEIAVSVIGAGGDPAETLQALGLPAIPFTEARQQTDDEEALPV